LSNNFERYTAVDGPGFASEIANGLEANGSLSMLRFSGDESYSKPVFAKVGMTEADFSGAYLMQSGAIILSAWLEHKVQHTTQTNLD
jgi:hypothetical protein